MVARSVWRWCVPRTVSMSRELRGGWFWYYLIAFYVASRLKTGDLIERFAVAALLFLVVPTLAHIVARRQRV